ncbi:MAG: hypothetical protein WCK24_05345, partial [Actinomycetes bacterium]
MVADFNGSTSAVNSAPPAGGSVGSSKSAKVTKLHTADQWGSGTTFLSEYGSANTLVSVGHKVVTMNVYAPGAGKRVWLKIEDAAEPTHYVEKNVVTTTAGWQLLTFDFSTVSSAPWNDTFTYNEASIFFDFGTVPSTDEDWYFDDVAFNGAVSAALSSAPGSGNLDPCSAGGLCITFESGYTLGGSADFGGNASSVVTAPGGGSVGSTKSAKIIKNAGETWAGTTFLTAATSASLLTDGNKTVTVNVYSASGKSVHLKLENSVNHAYLEESATTTTTGWQTLTFTFANNSNVYNMASIFFDFGNTGAGETYYFDDVHFPAGVLVIPPCSAGGLCITFESGYTLGGSADFGGNASSVVTAPGGGSVGSTKSAKIIKNAGETWAGTTFLTAATSASLLTDGNKTVTVNVYSASGKSVHLKLENSVNHAYLEESATTTTTGWQTLTFTFANNSNVYNMASIFFDFGNTGAGETYYFDDVHFPAGVLAGAPDAGPATHYNIKLTSPTLVGNSF